MFCDTSTPYSHYPLLVNRVKAAETRHLVPILANVFESLCNPDDPVDKQILIVLQQLSKFYEIMDQADYIMTPAQVLSVQEHIHASLVAYRHLSAAADGANEWRWHEVPKIHHFLHIGLQALYGNPRFHWCYMEEDFMGVLEHICARCTEGTPAIEVVSKMLQKWTFGLELDYSD